MKRLDFKEILEITFRLYVFFFITAYGVGKVIGAQFYTAASMPEGLDLMPIGQVSDFDLAWVFMGRSYGYMLFIGLAEVLGAILLLSNKTKLIGGYLLIPIMLNIVVFDIFFLGKHKGALQQVFKALKMKGIVNSLNIKSKIDLKKIGLVLLLLGILFVFDQLLMRLLGY